MDATEVHHRVPQHLLRAYDRMAAHTEFNGEGIELALQFEELAIRYGIEDTDSLTREGLTARIEASRVELPQEEHRETPAREWGSWGGRTTLARYGRRYFTLLALRRHGKIPSKELLVFRERASRGAAIPASVSCQPHGGRSKVVIT